METALISLPDIEQAAVLARPAKSGGLELAACLVARNGKTPGRSELRQALRHRLPEYMMPAAVTWVDRLPLNANGKVDRHALAAIAGQSPDFAASFSPPQTELEHQLAALWQEILGISQVGVTDNFFELGGHSLNAVHLTFLAEERLKRPLSLPLLFQAPTIAQLARHLESTQATMANAPSAIVHGNGAGPLLFHIPGMLGVEFLPKSIAQRLPPHWRYCDNLCYPGYQNGKKCPADIAGLAADLTEQMLAIQPRPPYLLSGYSFGGTIAFEVARQLEALGNRPQLLVLWDSFVPHNVTKRTAKEVLAEIRRRLQPLGPIEKLAWFNRLLSNKLQFLISQNRSRRGELPQWLDDVLLTPQQKQAALAVLHAAHAYQPGPYHGNVLLFRAEQFHQGIRYKAPPLNGWQPWIQGPVTEILVPADHQFPSLFSDPNAAMMTEMLVQCWAASSAGSPAAAVRDRCTICQS